MRRSETAFAEVCGACGSCSADIAKCLKSFNAEVVRRCEAVVAKSLIYYAEVLRAEVPHTPIATSAGAEPPLGGSR